MKFILLLLCFSSSLAFAESLATSDEAPAPAKRSDFIFESALPLTYQKSASADKYTKCEVYTRISSRKLWSAVVLRSPSGKIFASGGPVSVDNVPLAKGWRTAKNDELDFALAHKVEKSYDGGELKFVYKSGEFTIHGAFTVDPNGNKISSARYWAVDHNGKEVERFHCGDDYSS